MRLARDYTEALEVYCGAELSGSAQAFLHEHSRRSASPDHLPLRPPGRAGAAGRPAAAGAAFPHADPVLLAEGRAQPAFPQLAAGPAGQLSGAPGLPREDRPLRGRGRPGRRHDGDQPVRLLPRARRPRTFPSPTMPSLAEELAPFRKLEPPGPLLAAWLASVDRSQQRTIDFMVELNARLQQRDRLHHPHGAGRADREETLQLAAARAATPRWLLVQILRHLGLAARFVSGYLIQLTPDEKPLEGPAGTDAGLHRSPRLVRGLSARRRLDRPRPDLRPARRRGPHPARLHARPVERRADRAARSTKARSTFDYDMRVTRVRETPRTTKPYTDEQW